MRAILSNPSLPDRETRAPGWFDRFARRLVLAQLQRLRHGELTLIESGRSFRFGEASEDFPVRAALTVHDARMYPDIAFGGTIGAGETYSDNLWSTDDLTSLVRLLLRNRDVLDDMDTRLAGVTQPFQKALHRLRRNSRRGSRRNISAHYDLGNDFFELFLDESMMYSSAVFEREGMTLEEAAIAKLERTCRKLHLDGADHVLEIGAGWGGFAIHAASRYGCRVTTTTISKEQYDLARERVAKAGLADRVDVQFRDYRDLEGQYDKLVSIEMIEAVGHAYFDTYFRHCSQLLRPQGVMLLQAINIADQQYEQAKRSVDFIQRHIFPGGCLPSVTALLSSITRQSDMRVVHLEDFGSHYARTLQEWHRRLRRGRDRALELGYSEALLRKWDFYFCYCEGAFVERAVGSVQMLLAKPLARSAPVLGTLERTDPLTGRLPTARFQ